jgi:SRSO17 transposase
VPARVRGRRVTWRTGTKGPLSARFAATRVRVADGAHVPRTDHLPGEAAWLVGEWRSSGERKHYLTNHPEGTSLRALAAAIKARWVCEQAHQHLKEELGLDHYEGRSWQGLHHHALLTQIAFAFLQHLRLRETAVASRGRGKNVGTTCRAATTPNAADDTSAARVSPAHRHTALSDVPRAAGRSPTSRP